MAIKTYNSTNVALILNGTPIVGFARDEGISFKFEEDQYSILVDNRGSAIRSKLNNFNGVLSVTLVQDSASNQLLSNYAIADAAADAGWFMLTMQDKNGGTFLHSTSSFVKTIPEVKYALELGTLTWEIFVLSAAIQIKGI